MKITAEEMRDRIIKASEDMYKAGITASEAMNRLKYTTTPKKRGGPQPGSGRPPKDPDNKVVKCNVSMTKAHHEATEGDRAGMIRRALDVYLNMPE